MKFRASGSGDACSSGARALLRFSKHANTCAQRALDAPQGRDAEDRRGDDDARHLRAPAPPRRHVVHSVLCRRPRSEGKVGREVDGFTGTTAKEALKARLGDIARGKFRLPEARKPIPFRTLVSQYREVAEANHRDYSRTRYTLGQLEREFGGTHSPRSRASASSNGKRAGRMPSHRRP